MNIFSNIVLRRGAYGGANAFMRSLFRALERRGHRFVGNPDKADVALLNALSDGLNLETVEQIHKSGLPIVHRKTGFAFRGSAEMRDTTDGVPKGDRLQVEFDPYVRISIFQSIYSLKVFEQAGFKGRKEIIYNGVDESVFAPSETKFFGLFRSEKSQKLRGKIRFVISTWSTDDSKGFPEYRILDDILPRYPQLEVSLVGRKPSDFLTKYIKYIPPKSPKPLARVLRSHDAFLTLTKFETCSNALIEGLNCGLPALYLDSGSNAELAAPYGVAWTGDLERDVATLEANYEAFARALPGNPFRISVVAPAYERVLEKVAR